MNAWKKRAQREAEQLRRHEIDLQNAQIAATHASSKSAAQIEFEYKPRKGRTNHSASPTAAYMSTPIQQIRELRALHEEGLLSAHEFAQRKNGILDSVFRFINQCAGQIGENAELTQGRISKNTNR